MLIGWPGFLVKHKEVSAVEDAESQQETEGNNKRHLNVVFIGHVGRLM